ncbi:helix-turn-helix domain-containing protein, partial [Halanaerobium salsuginis]
MHIKIHQLKEMGFNKSQIARRLNISRPTLNKYYDLNTE